MQAGEITQAEYLKWRTGQVMIGQRWAEMRDTIAQDLTNADQIARSIAFGHMPDVYAINHDYGTYQVEKAGLVDTSYTLYDRQTFEHLKLDEDGNFIPKPGKKVTEAINTGKAIPWNKKNVQSVMMQGLMQGESIPHLATRLAEAVGENNRKVAIRNARTLTTGVQNAGRLDSYERAKEMGIKVKKQWLATLDSRTRHWHRELDGVMVENDEPFENEYGEIMYPGDPEADPANIYNCRCTMIAAVDGFSRDWSDREDAEIEGMTYQEWKEDRESRSDSILKQDEIAENMRQTYIRENYSGTKEPVISTPIDSPSSGHPGAIIHFGEELNQRQKKLLEALPNTGSSVIIKKTDANMKDLSALTAATNVEYAMFTKGGQRMIVRGTEQHVLLNADELKKLADEGYRFSGHTHISTEPNALIASSGDMATLEIFGMKRSVIYNALGQYHVFEL